ncbi:MAG: selenide, water dikinase SelD [Chitinophagaceae bacterium]
MKQPIALTQYSHGAGCGCKISPKILDQILHNQQTGPHFPGLLVGNDTRDDAAVLDLGNGSALISTTDFFMPIVDDPFAFGRIAAANAISDIYAMGGRPVLAIAILGWPVNVLPPELAASVIAGGRSICLEAGIPLGGGHSIDSPEPIFGLAVNGIAPVEQIKRNHTARPGDWLLLTKPLGVGILTTAEKKGILEPAHQGLAARQMMQLNRVGELLGKLEGVSAMTDITGFGLLGHLVEMAKGSNCSAELYEERIPRIIPHLENYILQKSIPGGTHRNWESYGHQITPLTLIQQAFLADPQTSGGLLIAVKDQSLEEVQKVLESNDLASYGLPIGRILEAQDKTVVIR